MKQTSFISVVPAIRTILGVEQFDYAVPLNHNICLGDVLSLPFRNQARAAMVLRVSQESACADKTILLQKPHLLLRCGQITPCLLRQSAQHVFASQPTVLASWLRRVPKYAPSISHTIQAPAQRRLPIRQTRFLSDRWFGAHGLVEEAKRQTGRILILTPWRQRAERLAQLLHAPALHSDVADVAAWKLITNFTAQTISTVIATRVGAWLSCIADCVLIDEPEQDDYKQDELTPRFDARWIVKRCAVLRPELSVIQFSTTPRIEEDPIPWRAMSNIPLDLSLEVWQKRTGSPVELLSPQTIYHIEKALEDRQSVAILHPILGERARVACSDCGWQATCAACLFPVSQVKQETLCKRCGRRGELPLICAACGGSTLTRGRPGKDGLAKQCAAYFHTDRVHILDAMQADAFTSEIRLLVLSDISLLGGASEDIRRKERLIIAWRRIAARAAVQETRCIAQGPEEALASCRHWLTTSGIKDAWGRERNERRVFGFPPAIRLVKLLSDADAVRVQEIAQSLRVDAPTQWSIRGPDPVAFRVHTRRPRYVIHVALPSDVSDETLERFFRSYADRAIIDLDPIAFFN